MEDQQNNENIFNLTLDQEAKSFLKTIAVWAKIIAIIAFVEVGLSLVNAFIGKESAAVIIGSIFAAMIGGLISVLLNVFLYRFAKKVGDGIASSNQQLFNEGVNSLRNYFKIYGIILIIGLSLILIGVFFVVIIAGIGAAGTN